MFIPETIDLGNPEKYDLVIRIKDDEFLFSISDVEKRDNRFISGTSFSNDTLLANVQRIIFDFNFLTQEFHSAKVIVVTPRYEIIPNKYKLSKEKLEMFNITHSYETKFVLACDNESEDSHTVFEIDKELYEFLSRSLFNAEFRHHTTPLMSLFAEEANLPRMYVNYHSDVVDILCYSTERLEHCLSYKDVNVRNHLYFILKLWEQCNYDQQEDQLFLLGEYPDMVKEYLEGYIASVNHFDKFDNLFFPNLGGKQAPIDVLAL